ncbi:MAG TPA: hypothetical protein PKY19_03925, partial [Oscillospiraceae bacterium]|nr:hypothetical protein [Oscillospiraceae bacterium]
DTMVEIDPETGTNQLFYGVLTIGSIVFVLIGAFPMVYFIISVSDGLRRQNRSMSAPLSGPSFSATANPWCSKSIGETTIFHGRRQCFF